VLHWDHLLFFLTCGGECLQSAGFDVLQLHVVGEYGRLTAKIDVLSLLYVTYRATIELTVVIRPLRTGDSDVEQLGKIFNLLGTPTAENWPKAELLPNYIEFEPRLPRRDFKTLFSDRRAAEYDLLMSLLQLDPARRPTATEVHAVRCCCLIIRTL
jgi:serine/threonine protein kinase